MKKSNKGFTIIELVVVIAAIAVLAAIMIPVLGDVTTNAEEAALQENLRNVYTTYVSKSGGKNIVDQGDLVIVYVDGDASTADPEYVYVDGEYSEASDVSYESSELEKVGNYSIHKKN